MSILKTILISSAVLLGGSYLFRLYRAGNKAIVQVGGRLHKVALSGVEVILKYNIKNPTNANIEMAAPLISLSYKGKVLASSSMQLVEIPEDVRGTNGIKISPFKETGDITTSILLPYLSLIGAGANLFTVLGKRLEADSTENPVKFEVVITSTIFTALGNYPYDEKMTITL